MVCNVSYIELFTSKILMFMIYCPDGIINWTE